MVLLVDRQVGHDSRICSVYECSNCAEEQLNDTLQKFWNLWSPLVLSLFERSVFYQPTSESPNGPREVFEDTLAYKPCGRFEVSLPWKEETIRFLPSALLKSMQRRRKENIFLRHSRRDPEESLMLMTLFPEKKIRALDSLIKLESDYPITNALVRSKLLLQSLWTQDVGWDNEISVENPNEVDSRAFRGSATQWKPFVANRVIEIQSLLDSQCLEILPPGPQNRLADLHVAAELDLNLMET
ncbi:hypothetical protein OS493_015436 [Desmophyllum pertusum]|uniref:Uncharacterized protein n=1 Tax=Desmophyllum pertusum TaxID=174260 RepID=A0A9W9Z465_9CNID|nr:hypothetical protein OS493_015436 [Desmophyllum pertusum]